MNDAIQIIANEIVTVLTDNKATIYLFGSVALGDFQHGWSDIDILVLTQKEITEQQAEILVGLRQALLERYPGNQYFRLFEGGMLSADAFLQGKNERTVYWGTSGQRITDNYKMDSFGMAELLDNGILLYGDDIRYKMTYPAYIQMRDDIARHVQAIRKYGDSVGWLLDIARGIYTLRTGKVIAKTAAGEWALEEGICPDADVLQKAVQIRKEPLRYSKEEKSVVNAVIQRFADVIDEEFTNTIEQLAKSELQYMNIDFDTLTLIRNKDGVSVWRITTDTDSFVMKCFDKPEYRREITNYQILISLNVPTLKVIAYTDCSLLIEDIERSAYRLGTIEDMNDPNIAGKIAVWYKILHQNTLEYANTHEFIDEYDGLTLENMKMIQEKTGTAGLQVWQVIEKHFEQIHAVVTRLPRTLVYTDFHFTNLAVARNGSSALVFDYNLLSKSYVYSDIRNVLWSLGEAAKPVFLSEYGSFDQYEVVVDDFAMDLISLCAACKKIVFPPWARESVENVKDGRLSAAVERLLGRKEYK
ncbi:MAG: nucleotidyltransferase domain-containing protein [Saccharofermentanales bacterium]